jgi:hypothetical protein
LGRRAQSSNRYGHAAARMGIHELCGSYGRPVESHCVGILLHFTLLWKRRASQNITCDRSSAGFGIMSLCIPGGPNRFSIETLRLLIAAADAALTRSGGPCQKGRCGN